jgi:hypothetical protein
MTGWASKAGWPGTAHYLEEDGVPACHKMKRIDGTPLLAPFKCTWAKRRATDPLCTLCQRKHGGVCECGRCTADNSRGTQKGTP